MSDRGAPVWLVVDGLAREFGRVAST
jgi:hypothetical protein